ncbi:MAG: SulP family inorganic anion transporter [Aquabacterium sp.]
MTTDAKAVWPRPSWQDALAGLSVAGLLIPEAVAYAGIGNMPPQAGVLALMVGLLVYGLTGGSRFAIVSATSSSAAVLLAATGPLAGADVMLRMQMAAGLVMLTGGLFLLGAVAKVGAVSAFISKPVLRGFAFGLALVIIIKQVPRLVGLPVPGRDVLAIFMGLVEGVAHWHVPSLIVGGTALLAMTLMRRFKPMWPAALLVMLAGIAAQHGALPANWGVATVGLIDLQLAPPHLPALHRDQWLRLGEVAMAMVLILYAESYGAVRTLALRHGDTVQPNRELVALGLANALSGLLHGMPVGAGYSASAANEAAGAQSRWAGLLALLVIVIVVLTCLPWMADMPEPVLSAIVIQAVEHMLRPAVFTPYFTWHRDRLLALAAVAAVLWLGVLDGLLVSIGASVFMTLRGLAQARVVVLGRLADSHDFVDIGHSPQAMPEPGMLILRPEAPLFFGNVESLMEQVYRALARHPDARTLILSLEESPNLDGTCVEALLELSLALARSGQALMLARIKSPVDQVLRRAAWRDGGMTMLSIDDAVRLAKAT